MEKKQKNQEKEEKILKINENKKNNLKIENSNRKID